MGRDLGAVWLRQMHGYPWEDTIRELQWKWSNRGAAAEADAINIVALHGGASSSDLRTCRELPSAGPWICMVGLIT